MKEAWKALGIGVVVVSVALGIWWVAYGAKVYSSEFTGRGDAIIQKNSAENWVKAQAKFEDMYAGIVSQDQIITVMGETYDADPSAFNKMNLDGARMVCLEQVGDYNAEARKYLSEEFRAADLPYEINTMSASTDCEE